jgi:hypothetical protein
MPDGGGGGGQVGSGYLAMLLLSKADQQGGDLSYAGLKSTQLFQHQRLNEIQRRQAVDAINHLGPGCENAFEDKGFNTTDLSVVASGIEFYSTYTDGSIKVRDVTGYINADNPAQTLSQYVGGSRAGTLPSSTGLPSNDVVLGAAYFTQVSGYATTLAASQNITLIHEALHVGTNQGDAQLYFFFDLDKTQYAGQAGGFSQAISSWLGHDCK